MRIVAAVKFADWLRVNVPGPCLDQNALLKVRLEYALRAYKECRPVVAMPVRVASGHNFCAERQHLGLLIARQRRIKAVEENISLVLLAGL